MPLRAFFLLALAMSLFSCRKEGFLGCDNIMAFRINGQTYNATQFNNYLLRSADPFSGVGSKTLVMETRSENGASFYLELTDFQEGVSGNCISLQPYYSDPFLNYCVPGVPFACNNYRAVYTDALGVQYVLSAEAGQVVATGCQPRRPRMNGNFALGMEVLATGEQVTLEAGSFSVCYLLR